MPLYLKDHSWGEFVFDFAWAEAWQRAGLAYYPRLVAAVPFTPATGPRLLARVGSGARQAVLDGSRALARELGLSSLHVLFPDTRDRELLQAAGLSPRLDCQFHWRNEGYGCIRGFPRRLHVGEAQESAARTPPRGRSRHRMPHRHRRRTRCAAARRDLSTARGDVCPSRQCAVPEPGILRTSRTRSAGGAGRRTRASRRRAHRLRGIAARRRTRCTAATGALPATITACTSNCATTAASSIASAPDSSDSSRAPRASTSCCVDSCRLRSGPCTTSPSPRSRSRSRTGSGGNVPHAGRGSMLATRHLPFRRDDIPARLSDDVRDCLAAED